MRTNITMSVKKGGGVVYFDGSPKFIAAGNNVDFCRIATKAFDKKTVMKQLKSIKISMGCSRIFLLFYCNFLFSVIVVDTGGVS